LTAVLMNEVCSYHHKQQFLDGISDTPFFCPKAMGSHRTLQPLEAKLHAQYTLQKTLAI